MMSEDLLQPGHVVKERWKVVSQSMSSFLSLLLLHLPLKTTNPQSILSILVYPVISSLCRSGE